MIHTFFSTKEGEMVLPENSNTGRIELGCQLRKADNSNITGIITCLRLGKAFKADDEGFLTMEYWIKSYKTIHGLELLIMQAEPGTIKTGDAILNYEWPSTEKELYIRNREELIHLKADANEYVIELHFSNDHSHQYALVFLILLIIVFLALSGMFKFKTR